METIEIGLVVIDLKTLEIVDEFHYLVRPQINPILTDFCKRLKCLQQTDVDGARNYQENGGRATNVCWALFRRSLGFRDNFQRATTGSDASHPDLGHPNHVQRIQLHEGTVYAQDQALPLEQTHR